MVILAFLLSHPLATEVFQKKEERVINETQLSLTLESGVPWDALGSSAGCEHYIHAGLCSATGVHV